MKRREFLTASAAAATALGMSAAIKADEHTASPPKDHAGKFKLNYAPNSRHFKASAGDNILDQIQFAADHGFTAWEENQLSRRPAKEQEAVGKKLADNGMIMGVFVSFGLGNLVAKTGPEFRKELKKKMRPKLDVAKRCGAKWTTIVPGNVTLKLENNYQTANCIDNLRALCEVCEPAGLVMVLEPLNWFANHPGAFLKEIPQSYMICRGVNSPSCKILNDLYHQQINEGNLIPNIDMAWPEIAYIQVGDNPGRKEPYTGEINYQNIFKHLYKKGYQGVVGMEHGVSVEGKEGDKKLIAAYRKADDFEV